MPVLSDGRVTLRALDERDIQGCYEQCIDPASIRWTQVPVPYSLEHAREFCLQIAPAAWADGSQWIFAVDADRPGGSYCGNIALRDEGHGRAEIAYGGHPAARGTGIMEAALRLLVEWGFSRRHLSTIIWRADVGNWASRKLAWRLGFTLDGVLRHSQWSRGELVDAWVGTLLAGEPREPRGRWLVPAVLEDDVVRLRPLREDDVPRVIEACRDDRTTRWLSRMPQPYQESDARAWIENATATAAEGTKVTWAVADRSTDVLVGAMNLFDIGEVSAEVGYWAHPDARGRGLTTAATRLAVEWGFSELGLQVIQGHAALDNIASRHVLESAGMEFGGVVPLGTATAEGRVDAAVYYRRAGAQSPIA